jgi:hypothetical protein
MPSRPSSHALANYHVLAAEKAKPRVEAARNEASEPASKTSRLPAKPVEKRAKGGERLDRIGLEIAALLAVDLVLDHSVSATPARKREQTARGDAFDPS